MQRESDGAPRARTVLSLLGGGILAGILLASVLAAPLARREVPDLHGLTIEQARAELSDSLLRADVGEVRGEGPSVPTPRDTVDTQYPEAGAFAWAGTSVVLDMMHPSKRVVVPNVVGLLTALGRKRLLDGGFTVRLTGRAGKAPDAKALLRLELEESLGDLGEPLAVTSYVGSSTPAAGEVVERGTEVVLHVQPFHGTEDRDLRNPSPTWGTGHGLVVLGQGASLCRDCHASATTCRRCHPRTLYDRLIGPNRSTGASAGAPGALSPARDLGPETQALVERLRRGGREVETRATLQGGPGGADLFFVGASEVHIAVDEAVFYLGEFPTEEAAKAYIADLEPGGLLPDGDRVTSKGTTSNPWSAPAHFFRKGKLCALYIPVGVDKRPESVKAALAVLQGIFGKQVAGGP